MNALEKALHQRALDLAKSYRKTEADLLEVLEKIDEKKVFRALGYPSLFQYALSELKLSEGTAYNFITVARKAREIPEIKAEVKAGNLSVAKVRKIVTVIQKENASVWLEKARSLPKAALEKEVARVLPSALTPERAKYVAEKRMALQLGVSEDLYEKLGRVKDLLSQKLRRAASLEDALETMADLYLDREDPVEKAKRATQRKSPSKMADELVPGRVQGELEQGFGDRRDKEPLPAHVKHEVILRDEGRCRHVNAKGERCVQRRWLDLHHRIPKASGGPDAADNLELLCFSHHHALHTENTLLHRSG